MKSPRCSLLVLTFAVLAIAACTSGFVISTDIERAPSAPGLVKIYLEPPVAFERIGSVRASSHAALTERGSVNSALDELKRQAAKLGANGVLVLALAAPKNTAELFKALPSMLTRGNEDSAVAV